VLQAKEPVYDRACDTTEPVIFAEEIYGSFVGKYVSFAEIYGCQSITDRLFSV